MDTEPLHRSGKTTSGPSKHSEELSSQCDHDPKPPFHNPELDPIKALDQINPFEFKDIGFIHPAINMAW